MLIVGALVILAGVGAGVISVLATRGPDHPDTWDPRVLDLVAFVEHEQGESFEHPVYVDFLDPETFDAELEVDEADLTDEDRDGLTRSEALLRALGAASGEVGLLEASNKIETGGTLAYYDPERHRVTVQGTELTIDIQVTVVHELVHAWQDQHDDIDRFEELITAEQDAGFRAVVEGEASLVEQAYVAGLDDDEREGYEATSEEQLEEYDTEGVPSLLLASQGAPYALGVPLLTVLLEIQGPDAIRAALADPPVSTEQLLDPEAYLGGDEPEEIDPPDVPGGGDALEEDTFGALTTYLLLADHVDPLDALIVADAWEGDTYVIGERDGQVCVAWTLALEGDAADDAAAVVTAWVKALPDAEATVDGNAVDVVACDPGPDEELEVPGRAEAVLGYPVIRLYLWAGMAGDGLDTDDAEDAELMACFVDDVLGAIEPAEMEDGGPDEDRFAEVAQAALRHCR